MNSTTAEHDLKALVLSSHPFIAIETVEEDRVSGMLRSIAAQTRLPLFQWSVTTGLTRAEEAQFASKMTAPPVAFLQHLKGLAVPGLFHLKDLSPHLSDPLAARSLRELASHLSKHRMTCVLTGGEIQLPKDLDDLVVRYELKFPDRIELEKMITGVVQSAKKTRNVSVKLSQQENENLLQALKGLTLNQARQVISRVIFEDGVLSASDIHGVLDRKAQIVREEGLLEYYPLNNNQFQIGGFANLKKWLERAHVGFSAEAKALNLHPPKGILIVGVPGCGKSLTAKVIARDWQLPLLKLDAGRLYDKYVGESEKNLRKAIALAESISPVVFWIDEIEKALGAGSGSDSDSGLSKRMLGAFLTWFQEKKQEVFIVATSNDVGSLPPELLRKGRFDEIFFVDLPTPKERASIWKIHLGFRKQDVNKMILEELVAASDGFSGSEIEQAVVASLYQALHSKKELDTGLIVAELQQTVPLSVSRSEDINRLRETSKGRFVSAT